MIASPLQVQAQAQLRMRQRKAAPVVSANGWPAAYINRDTGRTYAPHHDDEQMFVDADAPRYTLARGGEGGGKSVAGIIKTLNRIARRMNGIMVSPDLPHFRRSLWPEFQRWCPWPQVVDAQQRRGRPEWQSPEPFMLNFKNGASLLCGGIENPGSWEGPNVHFAHFDEARHKKTPDALKVLAGRVRLLGPNGEPPQLYLTTTPRKHWLFEYFGPPVKDDPQAAFKASACDVILRTVDNVAALDPNYIRERGAVLTESERSVLLDAEWLDVDDIDRFLPSIIWWDGCAEALPPLDRTTPLVLAMDAAEGVTGGDTFALIGVSWHPTRTDAVAVRLVRVWTPQAGQTFDYTEIEHEIRQLCGLFNVLQIAYDRYQLKYMMDRLNAAGVVRCVPFSQQGERLESDKQLLDLITLRRIAHDGNADLRAHLDNADRKLSEDRKLRIVKREQGLKIDLAVALSMAVARLFEQPAGWVPSDLRAFGGRAV